MGVMKLYPGEPDDSNREYLPDKLKRTRIVVNENGNNSQPYPERLTEYHGRVVGEEEDEWYEYIPSGYDPTHKTPLVVSLHGGMMTGWGQAVYTSWTLTAEQDGFIVLFPNAHLNRFWQVKWGSWQRVNGTETAPATAEVPPEIPLSPENIANNHDVVLIIKLIDRMKQNYNIDPERIFLQGMSMGNMMTVMFARHFGHSLAGAAGSGCFTFPSLLYDQDGVIIDRSGPLPFWQSMPEQNQIPASRADELAAFRDNQCYWQELNGCGKLPEIRIEGEYNWAFYRGRQADTVFLDIKNRDHGQTFDDAALVWDYFFSGLRRKADGSIVTGPTVRPRIGDRWAVAVTAGSDRVWFKNRPITMAGAAFVRTKLKYHGLAGGEKIRGEYLCVPLKFLAEVFSAAYRDEDDGQMAVLSFPDGRQVQFARGSIGCVIDRQLRAMYCEAVWRGRQLYVSIEWFMRALFNLHVSVCDETVYVTDHFSELSTFMAALLRDLLAAPGENKRQGKENPNKENSHEENSNK